MTDSDWAFRAYERVRARLPHAKFDLSPAVADNLGDLVDDIDVFLLDAFGVLNVGESVIPGAPARIAELRGLGKHVMVVTNAASYPKRQLMQRYAGLGFDLTPDQVTSSRETMLQALRAEPKRHWGLITPTRFGMEEFEALNVTYLADDQADYDTVDGVLFFGSGEWTQARQHRLIASMRRKPRPVLVGNPDIVAPLEGGLSREPGYFAHNLADETGIEPVFYGKPFANIFERVFDKLPGGVDRSRVVMVGDTLHTDILGGRAAGVRTALITDFGSLKGANVTDAIARSGIVPDFVLPRP